MSERKLVTISLPPGLLYEAEQYAEKEHRTKSEFFREALRFYMETEHDRKQGNRERIFTVIDQIQKKTEKTPRKRIRSLIREAIQSARRAG